jgi:hypothetical protein
MIGGSLFPTYRQAQAIQPLREPLGLSAMNQLPPGQRTLQISGAPFLPANPLPKAMLQFWKDKQREFQDARLLRVFLRASMRQNCRILRNRIAVDSISCDWAVGSKK